ncbi:hypothetical protein ACA910_022634 [Epithemia clementina (nom. ined.)]
MSFREEDDLWQQQQQAEGKEAAAEDVTKQGGGDSTAMNDFASTATTTTTTSPPRSPSPYEGCQEIFVGAGWGGIYSFYRRVLHGVLEQGRDGARYCLMEQSGRIGGRTYSVHIQPRRRRRTTASGASVWWVDDLSNKDNDDDDDDDNDNDDKQEEDHFVVDVGAYRFSPDMHLVGDLILHHLQLPTECYETHCPNPQDDFPAPFLFNCSAPLRRIIVDSTATTKKSAARPAGYATALHRMIETCRDLNARIFLHTQLVELDVIAESSHQPNHKNVRLVFENTQTKVRSAMVYNQDSPNDLTKGDDSQSSLSSSPLLQVLVLNLPRNHLLDLTGVPSSLDPRVRQTLECIVFDAPDDLFGPDMADRIREAHKYTTTLEKAYLYYDQDAWWQTLLHPNETMYPPQLGFGAKNITSQNVMVGIRWSDGPVKCDNNNNDKNNIRNDNTDTPDQPSQSKSSSCHGFLEIYYSVSNETFYSTLPSPVAPNDPLRVIWRQQQHKNHDHDHLLLLQRAHKAVMELLEPYWQQQSAAVYNASRTLAPPAGLIVGTWARPPPQHNQTKNPSWGKGLGLMAPTKVYYDPRLSGTPDQACGGVPGLTDETYRDLVLQPWDATAVLQRMTNDDDNDDNPLPLVDADSPPSSWPRIFLVNNDYVCSNVRYIWGDWAEESLMQAERAMYLLGTPKPSWIVNDTYYQQHVVQQVSQQQQKSPASWPLSTTTTTAMMQQEQEQEQQQQYSKSLGVYTLWNDSWNSVLSTILRTNKDDGFGRLTTASIFFFFLLVSAALWFLWKGPTGQTSGRRRRRSTRAGHDAPPVLLPNHQTMVSSSSSTTNNGWSRGKHYTDDNDHNNNTYGTMA